MNAIPFKYFKKIGSIQNSTLPEAGGPNYISKMSSTYMRARE